MMYSRKYITRIIFGENVYLTRKGAISAGENELGIIPGSMGDKSYIVRVKVIRNHFAHAHMGPVVV